MVLKVSGYGSMRKLFDNNGTVNHDFFVLYLLALKKAIFLTSINLKAIICSITQT
jgi:hypothetical protein